MSFTRSTFRLAGITHVGAASIHATVPKMDIFVRFEVWNVVSKAFEPAANMPVDLMDNDPVSNDLVDTLTTDPNGFIQFSESEADLKSKSGEDKPDLFFNARPKGLSFGGISLPDAWSTKGWNDKNGKPGFFPDTPFTAGGSLGGASATDPLVYRIGLDFHARFEFVGPGGAVHNRAPKGLKASIIKNSTGTRTDANGELHGLVFNIDSGDEVAFEVDFNIADPAINLPESTVQNVGDLVNFWFTNFGDADKLLAFPNNTSTSIGTQTSPAVFACALQNRNVAIFFLTMLYEHASFFFNITGGAWTGVTNLTFYLTSISGTAYSWPVGSVNIPSSDWSSRDTLIHEITHQVMWKEVGVSVVGQVLDPKGLCLNHTENMLANPAHAVIEGWAEILEGIFEPSSLSFTSSSSVDAGGRGSVPLGPPPVNQGESVEGAFANGMISVFKSFVVGSTSSSATVPKSFNGDVTTTAPWIMNADVKSRFKSAIWDPLHALNSSNPSTTDFLAKIKSANPAAWPSIVSKLNQFNMALEPPTVTAVSPASGTAAGSQAIAITGTGFISGNTQVTIGGNAATGISATSSTTLSCSTPVGAVGKVDIVVTTPVGPATLPAAYEYTRP